MQYDDYLHSIYIVSESLTIPHTQEGMYDFYANAMPFYIMDSSILQFFIAMGILKTITYVTEG